MASPVVIFLALALYWAVTSAPALSWTATCLQLKFGSGPCSGSYCSSDCYSGSDVGSGPISGHGFHPSLSWVMTLALALPQVANAAPAWYWAVIFILFFFFIQFLFGLLLWLWPHLQLWLQLQPVLGLKLWLLLLMESYLWCWSSFRHYFTSSPISGSFFSSSQSLPPAQVATSPQAVTLALTPAWAVTWLGLLHRLHLHACLGPLLQLKLLFRLLLQLWDCSSGSKPFSGCTFGSWSCLGTMSASARAVTSFPASALAGA